MGDRPPKIEGFPEAWESEEVHSTEIPIPLPPVPGIRDIIPPPQRTSESDNISKSESVANQKREFIGAPSMNDRSAVMDDLEAEGLKGADEWHKAFNLEEGEDEKKKVEIDQRMFGTLINYLEGDQKVPDQEAIQKFNNATDNIDRLELLRSMSLSDAISCVNDYVESPKASEYLSERLDFYQKLILGKATRKRNETERNDQGEWVEVVKEYPIDPSEVGPESIRLGVLRNILYAAMQGTPEMGAVKRATRLINEKSVETEKQKGSSGRTPAKIKSAVELFGYYSGISEGSIGQYSDLIELYKECRKQVEKRHADQAWSDERKEHKAVLVMADRLAGAFEYNGIMNTSASPYNAGLKEAVAAGQLGHRVMRQMRGMRSKIQDTRLDHIGRFIGKSGDSKYEPEKRRITAQIKLLKEGSEPDQKQELATRQNTIEVEKQQRWHERELERINHKYEKARLGVEKLDLPEEEKTLQLQSVAEHHATDVSHIQAGYEAGMAHLRERTPDQLLEDLEKRQAVVNERYEKGKSLAQKALDLHFKINHTGGERDSKPFGDMVDWINYAPLGTIKRAHKMLRQGASEEAIVEFAAADIICGARGINREDFNIIKGLMSKAKGQDWGARQKLQSMMRVGNIVSHFDHELSLAEIGELSSKNFTGMTDALRLYSLDQVKAFMNAGINLSALTAAKRITEKFGHDLPPETVAEIAQHNIGGLEDALRSFDLADTLTLLKQDVNLPIAVAVLNNTRQFGYELPISRIAAVSKNVGDINDFISALKALPLDEVESLFSAAVPYHEFEKVKNILAKHAQDSNFDAALRMSSKLAKSNQYGSLDSALEGYSLEEVNLILDKESSLSGTLEVKQVLAEKSIPATFEEVITFAKYASEGWGIGRSLSQSIEKFGMEQVRDMTSRGIMLSTALNVKEEIERQRLNQFNNIETIKAIAKHGGNIEVALKTLEAGFTIEEIIRFPFLISPLVTKK